MIRFRLDIAGEVQMDRGIARFADGVSDYRPIWPVIADEFYAEEKKQFETEGEEGGQKWAPLTPEYAAWKEARYPGKPILQRTGDLVNSLTSGKDPNAVYIEEAKKLTLGSKIGHGIFHQSPKPRSGALPRRPPILLTERFKRDAMRNIHVHLVEMASKLGFRPGLQPTVASTLRAKGLRPFRTAGGGARFERFHRGDL